MKKTYICDTSVIVDGRILELVESGEVNGELYVHEATIAELEHQANLNKEFGFTGFTVLRKLREGGKVTIKTVGERPTVEDVLSAKRMGTIDALIRRSALELKATLITGDRVQHAAAEAEGVPTIYLRAHEKVKELSFEKWFEKDTMSVHLKEGCRVVVKRGRPGEVRIEEVGKALTENEIRRMGEEIIEATKRDMSNYFEIDKMGASVIQMGDYRIVIAKPPFSDGFEITIVHPIKKLSFEDYKMSDKLRERIDREAEGIIVCGPPGSGKSTFAAALAEYYHSKKKVVKTMESPRDMRVIPEITQYTALEGDFENTKDILLMVRPDYTFYDEMRKSRDFIVFTDMRLAGIGLVGVVHGRRPIDAIQRFIGKVDLGVIPQVVDSVIMIEGGEVGKVYSLSHTVKVPAGMTERDLARPVIEVRDFDTGNVEFEIYKFGDETVVLPIGKGAAKAAAPRMMPLEGALSRTMTHEFRVEKEGRDFVLYAHPDDIGYLFGKGLKKLKKLEKRFGPIEVREL